MRVYKFRDNVEGGYAFIVAKNTGEAVNLLKGLTSLPFTFIESKSLDKIERPIVLVNNMLPF